MVSRFFSTQDNENMDLKSSSLVQLEVGLVDIFFILFGLALLVSLCAYSKTFQGPPHDIQVERDKLNKYGHIMYDRDRKRKRT
ncbi:hypothetical protein ACJX0J_021571, partial [Zea mays]